MFKRRETCNADDSAITVTIISAGNSTFYHLNLILYIEEYLVTLRKLQLATKLSICSPTFFHQLSSRFYLDSRAVVL